MIYGIGCDLCSTARMAKSLGGAHGPAFAARVFGPSEREALGLTGGIPDPLSAHRSASAAAVALNVAANPFGDAAIAAMSIVTRYMMFINSALIGFGQGFQPVLGYNYGAGRLDRVKEAVKFSVKTLSLIHI